jgi:arsenate reductase
MKRLEDESMTSSEDKVRIYHNPRCSKSRATLELLRERGIEPDVIEYLETPPNREELERILDLLGLEPRDLMRRNEEEYRNAGLDDPGLSRETLIQAMIQRPKLIQRPIVLAHGKAAIGRPPERVLEIL